MLDCGEAITETGADSRDAVGDSGEAVTILLFYAKCRLKASPNHPPENIF